MRKPDAHPACNHDLRTPALYLELSFDITAREQATDGEPYKQPPSQRRVARDDSDIERDPARERKAACD